MTAPPDPRGVAGLVGELIAAAEQASASLSHAYHTALSGELAEQARLDYLRLDSAIKAVRP